MSRKSETKAERDARQAARRAERKRLDKRAKLLARAGFYVQQDRDTGKNGPATRLDVVAMMLKAESIGPDEASAVRDLEKLIAQAETSPGSCLSSLERVSRGGDHELATAKRIRAAAALTDRQARMHPTTWGILREMCAGNLILTRWRAVVERRTGYVGKRKQAEIARDCFGVLLRVEEDIRREARSRPQAA